MKTFHLKVLACDHVFFQGKCSMVIVPALDGQLAIMAHHDDIIAGLIAGELCIRQEDGSWQKALIGKGIMQNINNRMVVLTESVKSLSPKPEKED